MPWGTWQLADPVPWGIRETVAVLAYDGRLEDVLEPAAPP